MISSPKPAPVPDPVATAQAQGAMNKDTAVAQAKLNNVNQVTPYGSLTYTASGGPQYDTASYQKALDAWKAAVAGGAGNSAAPATGSGPGGIFLPSDPGYSAVPGGGASLAMPTLDQFRIGGSDVPQYTATTTLSPEQQELYNLETQTQKNLGQLGVSQSAKVQGILDTPFDLNSAIGTQQSDIARTLLDPVWAQRESALQTRLANQGISVGSEAYTNAMRDFGMQRDNAYNSALLQGRGQAATEALTNRNQPLNEITALLGGSQVTQPNFVSTPQTSIQSPDYMGAVYNSAAIDNQNALRKQQQQNAMLGGLFGLGSAALGGWAFSDENLKTDIEEVGETNSGLPVYTYKYKDDPVTTHMGVMAQDVEKVLPEAVRKFGKYKAVDYSMVN